MYAFRVNWPERSRRASDGVANYELAIKDNNLDPGWLENRPLSDLSLEFVQAASQGAAYGKA